MKIQPSKTKAPIPTSNNGHCPSGRPHRPSNPFQDMRRDHGRPSQTSIQKRQSAQNTRRPHPRQRQCAINPQTTSRSTTPRQPRPRRCSWYSPQPCAEIPQSKPRPQAQPQTRLVVRPRPINPKPRIMILLKDSTPYAILLSMHHQEFTQYIRDLDDGSDFRAAVASSYKSHLGVEKNIPPHERG